MTVEISGITSNAFERFKQLMDLSVARSLHASLLRTEWHGTGYRVTAPGVAAFGRFHDGEVRVKIMMSFPATLIRATILADIQRTLRECGCNNLRQI